MQAIEEEETKMNDDTYKLTNSPLKTQFHQTVGASSENETSEASADDKEAAVTESVKDIQEEIKEEGKSEEIDKSSSLIL